MTKRAAGGPAFPFVYTTSDGFKETSHVHDGMTLRDHFAGQAMQSLIAAFPPSDHDDVVARRAFAIADAMLEERAK